MYTVKSSHFSIILTSLLFSVISAVITSDSASRRVSLKCAEGKKSVTWERMEGTMVILKSKYADQMHLPLLRFSSRRCVDS